MTATIGATHAQGVFTKMAWGALATPHTFDATAVPYDFLTENIARRVRFIGGNEIRGTRVAPGIRVREGERYFYGPIQKYISQIELDTLIPRFLGDESANVFAPDEDIPYFSMLLYRDEGIFTTPPKSTFEYKYCKIDRVEIRGRAPQIGEEGEPDMVTATFHIMASDRALTAWPGTIPAFGTADTYAPIVFPDCSETAYLNGSAIDIEEFVISVNNHLQAKYTNSLTPHSIMPRGRTVRLALRLPWNDTTDALLHNPTGGAPVLWTGDNYLLFTHPTIAISTKFEFGDLYVNFEDPTADKGKGQVSLVINAVSYSATSKAWDLKITNDSTNTP